MVVSIAFSVLALAGAVFAQDSRGLCAWQQIRGGVVRDSLYLEGGIQQLGTWSDDKWNACDLETPKYGSLFKLNFSKSFDIRTTNLRNMFEQINETLDSSAPIYADGTMFADDDEFYTIGGLAYPYVDNSSLAHGTVHDGLYQPADLATDFAKGINPLYQVPSNITQFVTHGAGVSIPSENLGFYFSGLHSQNDSRIGFSNGGEGSPDLAGVTVTTMMKVDTTHFNTASFTQLQLPFTVAPRAGASMVWIPTGAQGVLVVLGGVVFPADIFGYPLNDTRKEINEDQGSSFVNSVPVFDVANNKWYVQNTTGTVMPPPFAHACVVVASAADFSSHQIYVYGGWDGIGDVESYDDVWILSVPTFTWIRATTGSAGHGRHAHTCAKPYPDQMILVGGVSGLGGPIKSQAILDVYDLNNLNWTGSYDPTKFSQYKVPTIVTAVIGGSENGGSTQIATSMDSNLRSIFNSKYSKTITKWYPYKVEPTATPAPGKKSVAVPVAVSVVVVVVVLVTAIITWCCFCSPAARRKRSQNSSNDTVNPSHGFVSRWINNSVHFPPPPKSIISSDATEIGESLSPRAEVSGFSYFSPHARPSAPAEVEGAPLKKANNPHSGATSPGSPGSFGSAELEAPTPPPPMTEVLNGQRNTEVFRHHPFYPPSIGGLSNSSGAISGRYANARAPSETVSNAVELPHNRSTEDVASEPSTKAQTKSDNSGTETLTDVSVPTGPDTTALADVNQKSSGLSASDAVPQQTQPGKDISGKQQAGKSYPPTALSNIASQSKPPHHRSNSSASSGIAITMSPSTPATFRPLSPGEEQRRSDHIDNLPEHFSQNAQAHKDQ